MDDTRFDNLTRALTGERSRRGLVRVLAGAAFGGVLGSVRSDPVAAGSLLGGARCTSNDQCQTNKCVQNTGTCSCSETVGCKQPKNRCKKATCDVAKSRCVTSNKPAGSRCPDDGNPCTKDECDGKGACKHPKKKDGTACRGCGTCQDGICENGCESDTAKCCPDGKCGEKCCANGRACNVTCCGPDGNNYCCDVTRPVCICGGCWAEGSTQCPHPNHCCSPNQRCCGKDHCCGDGYECVVGCGPNRDTSTCCKGGQSPRCCPEGTPA